MGKKIAIVTGVSRFKGIGYAICSELARNNIDIFFTYWTPYDNQMPWKVGAEEPNLIQNEVIKYGVKCEKLELDLSNVNSVELLFNEVENRLGPASVLINNATYSTQTNITNFSAYELDKHYEINLRATTLLIIEFTSSASWKLDPKGVSLGRQTKNEIPHERVTQTYTRRGKFRRCTDGNLLPRG